MGSEDLDIRKVTENINFNYIQEIHNLYLLVGTTLYLCTSDTTPKVYIFRFYRDTFTVDGEVIHLRKHANQVILGSLLECKKSS